jgi:hypothetical protein
MTSDAAIGMIRTEEYFSLPPLYNSAVNAKHVLAAGKTYVFRGSTRATPWLSIL